MDLSDFNYDLPPELIAQRPAPERHQSRVLVMDRDTGNCTIRGFPEIVELLRPGDCLVVNDTKVIPGRLHGFRPTGGNVEILLLEPLAGDAWHCMMKPGRRMKPGETVFLGRESACAKVVARRDDGTFEIVFEGTDAETAMADTGSVPLPPYIDRPAEDEDLARYQTVYAKHAGAIAAPTAGLHFTPEILEMLRQKGVIKCHLTLHVGPGTFQPVKVEKICDHVMHEERYQLPAATAQQVNAARARGGRVVAVGTTSVRVLETCWDATTGCVVPQTGRTRLFLHPPLRPRATDALLTNFHLPKSTLLMLVSTFSSVDNVLSAYRLAIAEKMRFYSYGDCMLLL